MKRNLFTYITLLLLLACSDVKAETIISIKEYNYQASEADSKQSARWAALAQVKKLLLEEIGSYLESRTEVKNYMLSSDQIISITAGVVKTEIIGEKWNGEFYWVSAKVSADSKSTIDAIDKLRQNNELKNELERQKLINDQAIKEREVLQKQLDQAKTDTLNIRKYDEMVSQIADRQKRGGYYLALAKELAKKRDKEKEAQESRQKAIELLGEAIVNVELPEFKIYPPGKYIIELGEEEQMDHLITFPNNMEGRYTYDSGNANTLRVYSSGKILKDGEEVIQFSWEKFKFVTDKKCKIFFNVE